MTSKQELAKALFAKPEDIVDQYRMTDEESRILIEQTSCSEIEANAYFNKNKGDLEGAIFDFLESTNVLTKPEKPDLVSDQDLLKDEISTEAKLPKYRDILDHKDAMFQEKFDESSRYGEYKVDKLDYVPFCNTTSSYRKLNFKGTKEFFSLEILRPYLEGALNDEEINELSKPKQQTNTKTTVKLDRKIEVTIEREYSDHIEEPEQETPPEPEAESETPQEPEETETESETPQEPEEEAEHLPTTRKVILKKMVGRGTVMAKKWGCLNPVIAYLDLEDVDLEESNINLLATKFMRNCGYFREDEKVYGPAMVIDNWFM